MNFSRRVWIVLAIVLVGLAMLVPISSQRPDPIQHVLGIPGGVESVLRAIFGIGIALGVMWGIGMLLAKKKGPPTL